MCWTKGSWGEHRSWQQRPDDHCSQGRKCISKQVVFSVIPKVGLESRIWKPVILIMSFPQRLHLWCNQKMNVTFWWIHVYCNSVQTTETITRHLLQWFLVWEGQRIETKNIFHKVSQRSSERNSYATFMKTLPWAHFLLVAFPSAVTFRKIYKQDNGHSLSFMMFTFSPWSFPWDRSHDHLQWQAIK